MIEMLRSRNGHAEPNKEDVQTPAQISSQVLQTTTAATSGGDSGSEVGSDEGYRSLGVATTPPAGEKRSVIASLRDNETSGQSPFTP